MRLQKVNDGKADLVLSNDSMLGSMDEMPQDTRLGFNYTPYRQGEQKKYGSTKRSMKHERYQVRKYRTIARLLAPGQ
jgi:hypothetical protein